MQRVGSGDALFLELERPGLSMHLSGLLILDPSSRPKGPLTVRDLGTLMKDRIPGLPRLAQRLVGVQGEPVAWQHFQPEIREHVFHHRVRRGEALADLAAEIHEQPLDLAKPLWEMHLIDGLSDGRQALVVKTHHGIGDGLANVELARAILDPAGKDTAQRPSLRSRWDTRPSLLAPLQSVVGAAFYAAGGPFAPAGPFTGRVGPKRAFAGVTIPMSRLRRAKHHLGGTIDDLLLNAVAGGIADQIGPLRHVYPRLRVMLPVAFGRAGTVSPTGNHVTSIFVDLPLDEDDPGIRLRRIIASKSIQRSAHVAGGLALGLWLAGALPPFVQGALARAAAGTVFAHAVVTDVPGPAHRLSLLGAQVDECYVLMPLASRIGLSIAALTLGPTMSIAITCDPELLPEPAHLARAILRAFDEEMPHRRSA